MLPALQEFKNLFGRGFLLGVLSPVLIFVGTSLILYYEIAQGAGTALAKWEKLSLQNQVLSVLVGLTVITVLAYLVYNFQYSITRLFEGYWPRLRILNALRSLRIKLYRRRWEYLEALVRLGGITATEEAAIRWEQITFYPSRNNLGKLMPTRLGNILRASEIYPYDRYGIDSIIIWTRLHLLLTKEVLGPLESNQTTIDFMLLMSVLAAIFTLIWCPLLAFFTNRWVLFVLCSLGWPLAWICYQNAVQRALAYSEQFKVIFDLHRNDLLKALNLPIEEVKERERWNCISDFFQYGTPIPHALTELDKPQAWDQVATALAKYINRMNRPRP